MLDFYVKTRIGFSLRDKRLFEITEGEITRVDGRCQEKYNRNTLELQCIAERVYQGFGSAIRVTEILKMYALRTHFILRFLFSSHFLFFFSFVYI